MASKVVFLLLFCTILSICTAQDLLLTQHSHSSCEDICENTYPLHTIEKASNLGCCSRGCRLFTIIDFIEEFADVNTTRDSCAMSCQDAYSEEEEKDACTIGCNSQEPCFANRFPKLDQIFQPAPTDIFYPLLYVHGMYSNMFDKLTHTMSISWSFYMQGENGKLVVVKSVSPRFIEISSDDEYKTSNYVETNLEALDNSATPNFKQMHVLERDLSSDLKQSDEQSTDFLGCIARKTGMPKLLLSMTIFVSALVMIWLCVSSAVTAPDQHVKAQPQKLSIFGDLEYLNETADKDKAWLLAVAYPQDDSQNAPPLAVKLNIGQV